MAHAYAGIWLEEPTQKILEEARAAVETLEKRILHDSSDGEADQAQGFDEEPGYARSLKEAVARLRLPHWEAIYKERFFATPRPLYDDIVQQDESYLDRCEGHVTRRRARALSRASDAATCLPASSTEVPDAREEQVEEPDRTGQDRSQTKYCKRVGIATAMDSAVHVSMALVDVCYTYDVTSRYGDGIHIL